MKTLTCLLAGAALTALPSAAAAVGIPSMSFAVHDVIISSNIPILNISVRNVSASTDPALRDLRVTSPTPVVNVKGQVWCKSFQQGQTRADTAQVLFGNVSLWVQPGGVDLLTIGAWSSSPVVALGGNETLRNYDISAPVNFPDRWNGGISLGFNPVKVVEDRLEQYVDNGAGSEADFLRVDDVFETTVTMSAAGWCDYASPNLTPGSYAGLRQVEVPVHIFYHGDPDIQDPVVAVGSPGTIQAPPPPPGPAYAPPPARRGREATPPRRNPPRASRPDRAPEAAAGAVDAHIAIPDLPGEDPEALLVPAVQRNQATEDPEASASRRTALEAGV